MKMKKYSLKALALLLCMFIIFSAAACSSHKTASSSAGTSETTQKAATRKIDIGKGKTVTIPDQVTKIAASGRFIQEIIMLGGSDKLVVQADIDSNQSSKMLYTIDPALEKLPIVFASKVNVEELTKADPDVVITKDGKDAEAIAALGIPTIGIKNGDTPKDEVKLIAQVLGGNAVATAEQYCKYYDQTFTDVSNATSFIPKEKKLKVYVGGGNDGKDLLNTEGKNDIITKWIEAAGGINVATDKTAKVNGKQFSIESVIKWNPDVIIVTSASGKKLLETSEQWKDIAAVKNGRIYVCPKGLYLWSVRSAEGVLMPLWAGKTLHPELFTKLDMTKDVKDFYSTYYHYTLTDEQAGAILNPVD